MQLSTVWRRMRLRNRFLFITVAASALEILLHIWSFRISNPTKPFDAPFFTQCQEPDVSGPRENAVVVMLARNNEIESAARSVASFEQQFNRWFHYPIVFLNDVSWDRAFIDKLSGVASGDVNFEVIPKELWSYPDSIDQDKARKSMAAQKANGMLYAGMESYHHMCRFNSGKFYDHPALQKYKWFWRVDSDVEFTCAIPYDPFLMMSKQGKKYGYTMALWERGDTAPSLFREIDRYREENGIATPSLYTAMIEPSWAPWIVRSWLGRFQGRNDHGDRWNYCHFWSNFEIADMDFFRSKEYRSLFDRLDQSGGFYFERWGDAPVHSFAAAMLLKPGEVHYFEDLGYVHDNLQHCPANAKGGQLPNSVALGHGEWDKEASSGIGCRCRCNPTAKPLNQECQAILGRSFL